MRALATGLILAVALGACAGGAAPGLMMAQAAPVSATSPHILAALADPRRPAEDRERDANRHPAETLAFAGVEPGDRVADLVPGGGYFSRLFATAVGPEGRVYPVIRPPETAAQFERPVATDYANVTMARTPYTVLQLPEPVDVVFTAQNYHDLQGDRMGPIDGVNRAAFNALKPGGLYVIIDHSAIDGTPVETAGALHRIDQADVRRQVEAAGFVFDGEAAFLRNPEDPRTAGVFDPSIRGRTDQFIMRFRKPG